jgi:hypothetical protein
MAASRELMLEGRICMAKLEGSIAIVGLPPHRGLIVTLCFFPVESADAPAPYGGDPPGEAATDTHEVANQVDLHTESSQSAYDLPFVADRPDGLYYLQVRTVLFRTRAAKVFAQAEQFFFARRAAALAFSGTPRPRHAAREVAGHPTGGLGHLRRRKAAKVASAIVTGIQCPICCR